ncbi:MAG: hypothetical protein QW445_02555 [Candidatus Bathyarchaeia archaeon]
MKSVCSAEINLLWTGGWDSTFRLLYLVFVEKRCVQPFYIVDSERASTPNELETMHVIRTEVAKKNCQMAELIKPTIIVSISDIKADPDISAKFNRLNKKLFKPIGQQYEWLIRFAKQWRIPNLELCIERSENAPNVLVNLLSKYVTADLKMRDIDETDDVSIFSFFSFPLLNLSKNDMKRIAAKQGFLDVLEKTWFCRTPWHNIPCGVCVSCELAIKENFAYRLPKISRLRRIILLSIKQLSERLNYIRLIQIKRPVKYQKHKTSRS